MTIKKNWKNKSRQKMRNQPNTVIKIYAHLSTKGNTNSQTPETKFSVDLSQSLHFGKKKKKGGSKTIREDKQKLPPSEEITIFK